MSRSGYSDDCWDNQWAMIRWRGAVSSAFNGKRGQAFLREMAEALDAMPEKRLIAYDLAADGAYCAIGAVGARRGVEMEKLDPEDPWQVARAFDVAPAMVMEIVYMNDEASWGMETPEKRWTRMRAWVESHIVKP